MQIPLELAFHNLEHSDAMEQRIRERLERLERRFDRITSCRVVVEAPHRNAVHEPQHYRVRAEVTAPNHLDVIGESQGRDPDTGRFSDDPYLSINEVFDSVEKQLRTQIDKMQDRERRVPRKHHTADDQGHGTVARLFERDQNGTPYGFIEAIDGREIYFNADALIDIHFDELAEGDRVTFNEAHGPTAPDPVASTVRRA